MSLNVTQDHVSALYRTAFDQVCNPMDWKAPIDCIVPWALANVYMNAIEFMTGVRPSYSVLDDGSAQLTCCGYRLGPCGDC